MEAHTQIAVNSSVGMEHTMAFVDAACYHTEVQVAGLPSQIGALYLEKLIFIPFCPELYQGWNSLITIKLFIFNHS